MRRSAILVLVAVLLVPVSASAQSASLVDIEDEVMCVTCKIPLSIAESPQATRERDFIRRLIDRGRDKQQIKAALVVEYGNEVLALPAADGFAITAYAIPLVLVAVLVAALALLLPRWRRRVSSHRATGAAAALNSSDTRRLDEDLARYEQ